MSNKNTTSERAVPPAPHLPAAPAPFAPAQKPKTYGKMVLIFSIAAIVLSVLTAILPLQVLDSRESVASMSLFAMLGGKAKVLGFLPALIEGGTIATLSSLLIYALLCAILASIAFAVVAIIKKKPLWVYISFAIVAFSVLVFMIGQNIGASKWIEKVGLDIVAILLIVLAIGGGVAFFIFYRKEVAAEEEEEEAEPVLEAAPVDENQPQYEQYYEAYPYEGGPVIGVELAEEVNPTVAAIMAAKEPDLAAQSTVATLLGNGFDAFLITLNEKEKNEFVDIYVLKCKGIMPEIPGYVVGGDNKEFFNKVFIYLGQYREKIPADLLAKMYAFAQKI